MKKLMMALAVVACATAVQAANYNWKSIKASLYKAGTETLLTSGTAYLFDGSKYSQSALINAIFVDKTYSSVADAFAAKGIANSSTSVNSSGKVTVTSDFTYNGEAGGTTWNSYFVVVSGDDVFVSANKSVVAPSNDSAVGISMDSPKVASQAEAFDGADGWAGAGWYTASVPEPTSGLLLLLGMAGLALKRKRA